MTEKQLSEQEIQAQKAVAVANSLKEQGIVAGYEIAGEPPDWFNGWTDVGASCVVIRKPKKFLIVSLFGVENVREFEELMRHFDFDEAYQHASRETKILVLKEYIRTIQNAGDDGV